MEKVRYTKRSYLYGKHQFFLYEPITLDIVSEKYNEQGEATEIIYKGEANTCSSLIRSRLYSIVQEFKPDEKNMLLQDYRPVFVPCINNVSKRYEKVKTVHPQCRVLTEKHMSYTQLQCECCGEKSLIALNSWKIATNDDLENRITCTKK